MLRIEKNRISPCRASSERPKGKQARAGDPHLYLRHRRSSPRQERGHLPSRPPRSTNHAQPTHYEPERGFAFRRPKGAGNLTKKLPPKAVPARRPAVNCGAASPCEDRLYGRRVRCVRVPGFGAFLTKKAGRFRFEIGCPCRENLAGDIDTDPKQLLSPEDVARLCRLSRRAVYRAIARGELRAARLCNRLRISPGDLEGWIAGQTLAAARVVRPEERRPPRSAPGDGLRALLEQEGRDSRELR